MERMELETEHRDKKRKCRRKADRGKDNKRDTDGDKEKWEVPYRK